MKLLIIDNHIEQSRWKLNSFRKGLLFSQALNLCLIGTEENRRKGFGFQCFSFSTYSLSPSVIYLCCSHIPAFRWPCLIAYPQFLSQFLHGTRFLKSPFSLPVMCPQILGTSWSFTEQ